MESEDVLKHGENSNPNHMISDRSPINFQDTLPESVEVAIIGAGVIGISTAWFLAKEGLSVLVCEKGRVAGEQSSRNWGWVRQQGRDAAELPIMMDSIDTWETIAKEIGDEIGFTRHGVMYLARKESELAEFEKWLEIAKLHQLDSRLLSGNEVDNLITDKPDQWEGAMYTPSDGRAEPFTAVPAMARNLQGKGVLIRENCAVRALDIEGGRVAGIVTEHGLVKAQTVLCAGGAWSTVFMGNHDIKLPQLTVRATVARTEPSTDFYSGNAVGGGIAFRRRQDGGYTIAAGGINEHFISADSFRYLFKFLPVVKESARILRLRLGGDLIERLLPMRHWSADQISPFEKTRVLNPAPSKGGIEKMRRGLRKYLPLLAEIPFAEVWAGMIDVTPDVVPVMDEVAAYPGFYMATGFSGHGFGIGPGVGKVMANMVLGRQATYDLDRFRLSRFSDGTNMVPGPGL
ncbi:MAG: FAD-binding oxidoreductase [Gammaproteobacteria bacterium]|nr:FAD-binding oxidoreductase [Gammaproteobacteria bacterium]